VPRTILAILASIFFGATIAAPLMLSRAVRERLRRTERTRTGTIVIYGILSLIVGFLLFARLGTDVRYLTGLYNEELTSESIQDEQAVIRELWYRLMTPPPLRPDCYSSERTVCTLSDDIATASGDTAWGWLAYWQLIGLGTVSGLTSAVLTWLLTQPASGDEEEEKNDINSEGTSNQSP
jgi:hypothetical protein